MVNKMTNLKKMIATGLAGIVLTTGCAVNNYDIKNDSYKNYGSSKELKNKFNFKEIDESKYPQVKDGMLYVIGSSALEMSEQDARDDTYISATSKIAEITKSKRMNISGLKAVGYTDTKTLWQSGNKYYDVRKIYGCPLSNFNEKTQKMLTEKYDYNNYNKNSKKEK